MGTMWDDQWKTARWGGVSPALLIASISQYLDVDEQARAWTCVHHVCVLGVRMDVCMRVCADMCVGHVYRCVR